MKICSKRAPLTLTYWEFQWVPIMKTDWSLLQVVLLMWMRMVSHMQYTCVSNGRKTLQNSMKSLPLEFSRNTWSRTAMYALTCKHWTPTPKFLALFFFFFSLWSGSFGIYHFLLIISTSDSLLFALTVLWALNRVWFLWIMNLKLKMISCQYFGRERLGSIIFINLTYFFHANIVHNLLFIFQYKNWN